MRIKGGQTGSKLDLINLIFFFNRMPVLRVFTSLASALQRPTDTHFRLTSDLEGPPYIGGHCALQNIASNVKINLPAKKNLWNLMIFERILIQLEHIQSTDGNM